MARVAQKRSKRQSPGVKHGWRSGLEERIGGELATAGTPFLFERIVLEYTEPEKRRRYTPDFVLLDNWIVVESKGRFVTADRQKHLLLRRNYPDLDLRFVFQNPNAKISKTSKTTYAAWCDKHGFQYAKGSIPEEWTEEPVAADNEKLLRRLFREQHNCA